MTEAEIKYLVAKSTPVVPPETIVDDEKCLVLSIIQKAPSRPPWYKRYPPPLALLTTSAIEVIIYASATVKVQRLLRFDPNNQIEIWRFVTYICIHNNVYHLILNVIIQCLFAVTLEKHQGGIRVGILYFASGTIGALGASCIRPDLVVGASAGVYALLISHLAHILLNFDSTKHKLWICATVIILVTSDVSYNVIHSRLKGNPIISEGAHIGGAISGLFLGLLLYRSKDKDSKFRNRIIFWIAFVLFLILIFSILIVKYQIKKCTPFDYLKDHYVYSC